MSDTPPAGPKARRHLTLVKPPVEEAYATGIQPSASRSNLLLECAYWVGKAVDGEVASEPARYGSAYHEVLAAYETAQGQALPSAVIRAAQRYGMGGNVDEINRHVLESYPVLQAWLHGKNEYKLDFSKGRAYIEQAVALRPLQSGRWIKVHDEDHRYHGVEAGEIPGTLDRASVLRDTKKPVLVLDHKTGEEDFSRPLDKAQLLTLTAAVLRITGRNEAVVAVNHARRRGMAKVYSDRVKLHELKEYEGKLKAQIGRVGDGSMRPNSLCKWCPAQPVCPAQDAKLLESAGDVLTGLTAAGGALSKDGLPANGQTLVLRPSPGALSYEKKLGTLYEIAKKAEILVGRVREEIKKALLADRGLLPEIADGYLIIREFDKENLSKKSVIDAYGKTAGEKLLEKLRKDGAITMSHVQQLYPEKEKGR